VDGRDNENASSQTLKAVLGLRGMILAGELAPGERVLEQRLVERLGVSRTPARMAILRVCEEGLVASLANGGFAVARFSMRDVFDAICVRGSLEGMAARLAAEREPSPRLLGQMQDCVDRLDELVDGLAADPDLTGYVERNDRFHELLLEAAQSPMVQRSLEHMVQLPFATPNGFVSVSRPDTEGVYKIIVASQDQHRSMVEAIRQREGSRAAAIAMEHSRSAWKYLQLMLRSGDARDRFPAMRLVVEDAA
jgi:GntR family transcriptional regulator of vanillate catabolism